MKADFTRYLGPLPSDAPKYIEPEDSEPLKDPDPAVANKIRLELARRQRRLLDGELVK